MNQVQAGDVQIGDTEEKEIVVVDKAARVEGKHENAEGNNDAKYFREAVKQQVAVKADKVESKKRQSTNQDCDVASFFNHRKFSQGFLLFM